MLNMDSATGPTVGAASSPDARPPAAARARAPDVEPPADDDRTARARIRDAAIERFGRDGTAATSLRAIAADAGVSPPLVVHHFGSKEGLRAACDRHVAATIREGKQAAMAAGPQVDALAALRQAERTRPLLRYLARVLVDPSPEVAALVDELVADAVAYLEQGVRTGMLRPTDDPRGRATVLTMWSLGALVLHEHVARLLGADLTADDAGLRAYARPATRILGEGVLAPEVHERIVAAYDELDRPTDPQEGDP
jgi:AcrR family transcriptional regulator